MKYNNVIFLGLCLGLTTYSALSADSVIKISGRVLDYGCTVSSDSLNFTVDLQKNSARQFPWICPYISRHLLSLNPLQARCRR
ncbi:fimbrial protein, partial [Escherichia coli]|nr:fimbrial protein [Escherichia coli]